MGRSLWGRGRLGSTPRWPPGRGPRRPRAPAWGPGARGVRGAVLSARAAGGLSVRERPGPIQWPLSAGPFVQEAATSCGAGLGQAGRKRSELRPRRRGHPGPGSEVTATCPGPPWALGRGFPSQTRGEAGLSSALSSGSPCARLQGGRSSQNSRSQGRLMGAVLMRSDPIELREGRGRGRRTTLGQRGAPHRPVFLL